VSYFLGIDIGSVSVDLAVVGGEKRILETRYVRHRGEPGVCARGLLADLVARRGAPEAVACTGSGGRTAAGLLGARFVNEVVAQARATTHLHPEVRSVVEIGGQDAKLIALEPGEGGVPRVVDFAMNTVCAAGTGSFLDQQAARLGVSIEDEFGRLALESEHPATIAGRCSVFAKTDMIHLQQLATPACDIIAGLCLAMARNFRSNIARGKKLARPVALQGGVAANAGMRRAFREALGLGAGELVVPEHFAAMGAIGAALALIEEPAPYVWPGLDALAAHTTRRAGEHEALAPLPKQDYVREIESAPPPPGGERIEAYLGVDVGSISTNVVVIDRGGRVLARRYLMTAGRPIEAVRRGIEEVGGEVAHRVEILGAGTTGSGRYLTGDFIGADAVKNEITAHARGAAHHDAKVDTIFEIGGQDSKYVRLENGAIVDFAMNKVCAAGTGSFLEEQAEKLGLDIKGEFADLAFTSERPAALGERCTVFMESDLNAGQQRGVPKRDLVAGLAYSIVKNYLNRVVENRGVGERIFFQGGTAANKAVKAAFEAVTGKSVTVPPHHDVLGAVGVALIARDERVRGAASRFKGFDLARRRYTTSSFECKACSNNCEIRRVEIEGEKPLHYGSRCGKFDEEKRSKLGEGLPDLFAERRRFLLEGHDEDAPVATGARTIGLPQVSLFLELYPFWRAFFIELGWRVVISSDTNKSLVREGLTHITAETCFPIKVAHGHVADLLARGVDAIFLPSIVDMPRLSEEMEKSYNCPYVQALPYMIHSAMDLPERVKLVAPVVHLSKGEAHLVRVLASLGRELGAKRANVRRAIAAATDAQHRFYAAVAERGRRALAELPEGTPCAVLVSRPYNGCDPGLNLDLPSKLRDLGCIAMPMDFLPLDEVELGRDWWHMYWKYGQKILAAGRIIARDERLHAVYITNFGCGPDSFISKFFARELGEKPFLTLEVDEHSADVGAITRLEAFLDSIRNAPAAGRAAYRVNVLGTAHHRTAGRTVYIPYMDDHTYGLAAAMRAVGLEAEVLPVSDEKSVELGRRYTTGKECYPCVITTGDFVKKALSDDFDPTRSAFFMPTAMGPCRFGQYNKFHRMVLDDLGFGEVEILAFRQNTGFHHDTGQFGAGFMRLAWRAIVAVDVLGRLVRAIRPYEAECGTADRAYARSMELVCDAIAANGDVAAATEEAARLLAAVPADRSKSRPRIGIIGEVYVRCHKFANEGLVRGIERLGGEASLPPFEEWMNYVSWVRRADAVESRRFGEYAKELAVRAVQGYERGRIARRAARATGRSFADLGTEAVIELASPYLDASFRGEAVLSMGRAVEYAEQDFAGIVNLAPFNCLPSTVVASLMRRFRLNHRGIPTLDLYFDGSGGAAIEERLEAFMFQATSFLEARRSAPVPEVR